MSFNLSSSTSRATKRLRISHNNYVCDTCDISFETYRQLNNHKRNHSSMVSRPVIDIDDMPTQEEENNYFIDDNADIGNTYNFIISWCCKRTLLFFFFFYLHVYYCS